VPESTRRTGGCCVRVLSGDLGQCEYYVLDPLIGRQQPERQQHQLPLCAETILVEVRINERDIRDSMGDYIDVFRVDAVDVLERSARVLAHHNQPVGKLRNFLQHQPLVGIWMFQNRVQRGDQRHPQFTQKSQYMAARPSAENSVLVLQANQIHFVDVQEIRCALTTAISTATAKSRNTCIERRLSLSLLLYQRHLR
jgi:hypothetical protein